MREVGLAFTGRKRSAMLGVMLRSTPVLSSTVFGCWLMYTKAARRVKQLNAVAHPGHTHWATDSLDTNQNVAGDVESAITKVAAVTAA